MQTHRDDDASIRKFFGIDTDVADRLKRLEIRAQKAMNDGTSSITAGSEALVEGRYTSGNLSIAVRKLPDDSERVLRISIGEMEGVEESSYLVFRGDIDKITKLLKRAVWAIEHVELKEPV